MPRPQPVLSFRMFHKDQLIREDTLALSVIKIGKIPSAHLQIADDTVSRMHAIIEVTGGEFSLIDLGSTRGTFVNGKRINKARLQSGDVITLGDTRLELTIRDAASDVATAARPPAIPAARRAPSPSSMVSGVIETSAMPASPAALTQPIAIARPAASPPLFRYAVAAADDPGAARAVEVAAMLGDSVVSVKHCLDPRSGKVSAATWGVVAGAAVCLVASAIAFVASVRTAADNRARLDAWTRVEHRPAYAFRPQRLGAGADWVAFGGLGLALVGFSLGIARLRRERVSPFYRIGTAPGVELAIESAPSPAFPLVAPSGDDFVFNFVPGAPGSDGELLLDGSATPLAELAAAGRARPSATTPGALEVPIPRNARIRARAGRATVMVSAVARPRRHVVPLRAGLERRAVAYVAGSLVLHLAIWGALQLVPPDATSVSVDLPVVEPIAVAIQAPGPDDRTPPPSAEPGEGGGDTGSPAMALPSGASGDPAATEHGRLQIAQTDAPPQLSRSEAIAAAREAGVLGSEQLLNSVEMLAEIPGLTSGFDLRSFTGPMIGADGGSGPGGFGGGLTGDGLGGGCGLGTCGVIPGSGYATISDGPGTGGTYGLPGRGPGNRVHYPSVPRIGAPEVIGAGYDKSLIRRYIRRSIDKIGYCYDKQLLAHPDLDGVLTVNFFIAPTGGVQRASGSGFDPEVAACVSAVIMTIAFPRPGDGVGVEVHYPFQFHAAGR
jgi:FHA domain